MIRRELPLTVSASHSILTVLVNRERLIGLSFDGVLVEASLQREAKATAKYLLT